MEKTCTLKLDALERDWIAGVTGSDFRQQVESDIARIEAVIDSARRQGVLIAHAEPVDFAAAYFASVYAGVPVILANAN